MLSFDGGRQPWFWFDFFIVRSSWPCAFLRWFDCHMKYNWICSLNAFVLVSDFVVFHLHDLSRCRASLPHGDYGQVGRWSCLNLNVHLEGCLMFSLCNGTVMNWTHWWMWFWGKTIGFCRSSCWSAQWEVNGLGEVLRIFKDVWNTFWVIHWTWN